MDEKDRKLFTKVVSCYHETHSIRDTAIRMDLSRSKVRKILITMGELTSEITEQAVSLLQQGKSQQEIAQILIVSETTLSTYLPYGNRVFNRDEKSDDAVRSEKYRARQVKAARDQVHRTANNKNDTEANNINEDDHMKREEMKMDQKPNQEMKILRLQLELETTEDDLEILRKYGKVEKGIIREICVPSYYPLHALHFAIQKMFGWQNCHLHHYELPEDVFIKLTKDCFMTYCRLCGLYFRFPYNDDDMREIYWDDDYKEGQSFRSWLKSKYSSPYYYRAFIEHHLFSQIRAKGFCAGNEMLRIGPTFEEYTRGERDAKMVKNTDVTCTQLRGYFEIPLGELIERAGVGNFLFSGNEAAKEVKSAINEEEINSIADKLDKDFETAYQELTRLKEVGGKLSAALEKEKKLLKRKNSDPFNLLTIRAQAEALSKEYEEGMGALLDKTNAEMPPVCSELRYEYDYGDGWTVTIRCTEEYTCVFADENAVGLFREDGSPLEKELSVLLYDKCVVHGDPVCIAVDGLPVFDDVGGPGGFCDFLKCIRGKTADERMNCRMYDDPEWAREWARDLGWTGRMSKPENML